jgi:aspartyl-tRNA(Asn)/glutamyl-tRNA(Gln) amidotransferase subunit A
MTIPNDPLAGKGLKGFAADFRAGRISSEHATRAYLERIKALDPKLQAFEHVAHDSALAAARAIDALYAAGTDLGPLMGVPIAIKDVFTINGMPAPHVGSNMPLPNLTGNTEGPFIQALRRAGCVFLGQTKAVELCLGINGVSTPRGTPWNAADMEHHRAPGGSSSGSGVAVGAGLCAFAIGSDSGGSVRVPAAFNGVFGYKSTARFWPSQGAFPLDPPVDTIGLLTPSARDAQIAFETVSLYLDGILGQTRIDPVLIDRLRLGIPSNYFFDGLDPAVSRAFDTARQKLAATGLRTDAVDIPEANERDGYFPLSMPSSLLGILGVDFFQKNKHLMDQVVARRVASGMDVKAHDYIRIERKRQASIARVRERFQGFDAWIAPTTLTPAPLLSEFDDPENAMKLALGMTHNTQPANYLELCAVSLPVPGEKGALPVGLQLMAKGGSDAQLLAIAVAVEESLQAQ